MSSFLDQSAGYLVNMAAQLLKRELSRLLRSRKINVTAQQWAVLNRLNENEGLTQSEISVLTFKDNANITHIVDKLEEKKYIERSIDPNDRRTWRVNITSEGKVVRDRIEILAKEVLQKATKGVTKEELGIFNSVAERILKNLGK
ncbi:MAG: MarR family transcriptional regulator [bacterium]|nr:MarR family transcriptional regulator [bacterium]